MYTLTRQLYFGSCEVIKAAKNLENPLKSCYEVLNQLSTMPDMLQIWKRSSCRAGVMRGLALAKAYHSNLDPALLMNGFPQFNSDGTEFDKKDYARARRQTRYAATIIASKMKLRDLQYGYNEANEAVVDEDPKKIDLLQSCREPTTAGTPLLQVLLPRQALPLQPCLLQHEPPEKMTMKAFSSLLVASPGTPKNLLRPGSQKEQLKTRQHRWRMTRLMLRRRTRLPLLLIPQPLTLRD